MFRKILSRSLCGLSMLKAEHPAQKMQFQVFRQVFGSNRRCFMSTTNDSNSSSASGQSQQKFNTMDYIDVSDEALKNSFERESTEKGYGKLTICPTPLGNLSDMSVRQYRALLNADVIACEDTRITGMLLKLIKEKRLKQTFEEELGAEGLDSLKAENGNNSEDPNGEDDTQLLESDSIDIQPSARLTREERIHLKILELRNKAKVILKEEDTLNYFDDEESDPLSEAAKRNRNQGGDSETTYGLEDEFIRFLKAKIMQSKKRKGRGILISYHKYNEDSRLAKLLKIMRYGLNIVLVSDAGTPTISDPGYRIVNKCIENFIQVESLPGPSSVVTALSKSGYPADQFHFQGYLPKGQQEREEALGRMKSSEVSTVIFESVNRLFKTLLSIEKIFGEKQQVFLSFELTKLHEKSYRAGARELYELLNDPEKIKQSHLKGELTMVIPPFQPQYNKELLEEQYRKDKRKNFHMEWENDEQKLVQVEPKVLATQLNEVLETSDQELAQLLSTVLRISRTRAMSLVSFVRHHPNKMRNWDQFIDNYTEEVKRKEKRGKREMKAERQRAAQYAKDQKYEEKFGTQAQGNETQEKQ